MWYNKMYESISKNNELENEMTLDMSYFWYSDEGMCSGMENPMWNAGKKEHHSRSSSSLADEFPHKLKHSQGAETPCNCPQVFFFF